MVRLRSSFLVLLPHVHHRSGINEPICTHARCHKVFEKPFKFKLKPNVRESRKHLALSVAKGFIGLTRDKFPTPDPSLEANKHPLQHFPSIVSSKKQHQRWKIFVTCQIFLRELMHVSGSRHLFLIRREFES